MGNEKLSPLLRCFIMLLLPFVYVLCGFSLPVSKLPRVCLFNLTFLICFPSPLRFLELWTIHNAGLKSLEILYCVWYLSQQIKQTLILTCSPLVCIYMVSTLSYVLLSTLIIELLLPLPPALWSIFKHLPIETLKLFSIFYSNTELDESGTSSPDITTEFQTMSVHSSSANLKRTYLNHSVTQYVFQNSNGNCLKKTFTRKVYDLCR